MQYTQNQRFCNPYFTKLCKIMQKNAKICKKICIYKKKVVILHQISEEVEIITQKENQ